MGCYLSCLEIRKGRLYDRLRKKWVDHEEVPTLPLNVVEMMEKLNKNKKKKRRKKGGKNEKSMER